MPTVVLVQMFRNPADDLASVQHLFVNGKFVAHWDRWGTCRDLSFPASRLANALGSSSSC